ncbi:hypothetical protein FIBSPDRAFT_943671 [Athelia psychrophila]|uniref:Uncharacterized protein n=1 Tax=Athelia psychrophila TaxID=1759441 RepID=A0A166W162_9AGAM|nr:hypothetical protein FIBSPDRAFT_943671 [Fibularhizoctonia sp. CBS 109695]
MSMGEADAKFPGQHGTGANVEPPSPTRENPGQVYPKSDPSPAPSGTGTGRAAQQVLGNPYLQTGIFQKLDQALVEVVRTIEGEQSAMGASPDEAALIKKFEGWRDELEEIMSGRPPPAGDAPQTDGVPAEDGGLFTESGGMFTD